MAEVGGTVIAGMIEPLRELLGASAVCGYGLRQLVGDHQEVSFRHSEGLDEHGMRVVFTDYVARGEVRWGAYNPGRPEPGQRNRLFESTPRKLRDMPLARTLYPRLGIGGMHQLRALVCDGPSLLAWVGGWQDARFEARQRAILAALVPDLQRRLAIERQLARGPRSALLEAALEAVGRRRSS